MTTSLTVFRLLLSSLFLAMIVMLGACKNSSNTIDVDAYKKGVAQWQEQRAVRLKSETGWLTLCGLFWLKEGENTFGTDSSNSIIFPPGKSPNVAGSIWLENGVIRLQARPGTEIKLKDSLVTSIVMQSDEEGNADPTVLNLGTLTFQIIKRSNQLGVRVKDKMNPERLNFKGMDYFPVDLKWRIEAKFAPYTPPKIIPIASIINTVENDTCPGSLTFSVDGKECQLDAVMETGTTDQLFIMFSDETAGKETYGLGRQLYTSLPDSTGTVILDFNRAFNWPCVFSVYATCPIPPKQNHLPIRVEAGEKMYAGHH